MDYFKRVVILLIFLLLPQILLAVTDVFSMPSAPSFMSPKDLFRSDPLLIDNSKLVLPVEELKVFDLDLPDMERERKEKEEIEEELKGFLREHGYTIKEDFDNDDGKVHVKAFEDGWCQDEDISGDTKPEGSATLSHGIVSAMYNGKDSDGSSKDSRAKGSTTEETNDDEDAQSSKDVGEKKTKLLKILDGVLCGISNRGEMANMAPDESESTDQLEQDSSKKRMKNEGPECFSGPLDGKSDVAKKQNPFADIEKDLDAALEIFLSIIDDSKTTAQEKYSLAYEMFVFHEKFARHVSSSKKGKKTQFKNQAYVFLIFSYGLWLGQQQKEMPGGAENAREELERFAVELYAGSEDPGKIDIRTRLLSFINFLFRYGNWLLFKDEATKREEGVLVAVRVLFDLFHGETIKVVKDKKGAEIKRMKVGADKLSKEMIELTKQMGGLKKSPIDCEGGLPGCQKKGKCSECWEELNHTRKKLFKKKSFLQSFELLTCFTHIDDLHKLRRLLEGSVEYERNTCLETSEARMIVSLMQVKELAKLVEKFFYDALQI